MASGIFAVLDDIAMLMDDVVMMSKMATKKTAGILGDDLAVNAEKATGFVSSRELPVLWSITKGSFINKLIILPAVFLLNFFLPIVINYVLILGGFYLAYEGVEKIIHTFIKKKHEKQTLSQPTEKNVDNEKKKIKSAITTDFILSLEIIIIALGTVLEEPLMVQILTVSIVSILAVVGVYGLVALIVRLDDAGLKIILKAKGNKLLINMGNGLVRLLPLIIRFLAIVGTIALILVSGGIFMHNIEMVHHIFPTVWYSLISEALAGLAGGLLAFIFISIGKGIFKRLSSNLITKR